MGPQSQCLAPRPGPSVVQVYGTRTAGDGKEGEEESLAMAAVAVVDFMGTNFATSIVMFENSRKAPYLLFDIVKISLILCQTLQMRAAE